MTIVNKPYPDGVRSLAMIIVPTADIKWERVKPENMLKASLVEVLAIWISLLKRAPSFVNDVSALRIPQIRPLSIVSYDTLIYLF